MTRSEAPLRGVALEKSQDFKDWQKREGREELKISNVKLKKYLLVLVLEKVSS